MSMNVNQKNLQSVALRPTAAPRPTSTSQGLTGTGAVRSDCWAPQATAQLRLGSDGSIMGPTGRVGSMDASYNFTLEVGGQKVQGNLLELLIRSMVEQLVSELVGDLSQQKPGATVTADGRGYEVMPQRPTTGTDGPGRTTTTTPTTTGSTGPSPTRSTSNVEDNARLPIWNGFGSRASMEPFLDRMRNDRRTPAERTAAIAKLDAFAEEMGWPKEKGQFHENRSTFVPEVMASGLIYSEEWFSSMRDFKRTLTDDLKRSLGRDPTMDEMYRYVPHLGQLPYDRETVTGLLETQQRAILRDTGNATLTRYSDAQVRDGVNDYLRQHPNASEVEIRSVAKNQYGVSDAQLDRVKAQHFSAPAPKPKPKFSDREVADGVRDYIRNNPGATEAQIRQVAQSQYGISTEQLDRVKADHFS